MPATTSHGAHIITVRELQEMLARFDPNDRIMSRGDAIDRVEREVGGQYLNIKCGARPKLPARATK